MGEKAPVGTDIRPELRYADLRDCPERTETAAEWFHDKWGVPKEAYQECMKAYLDRETEYGWYLCLYGEQIVGGMGVIENDFHDRKDLAPNVCAVYTEEAFRGRGDRREAFEHDGGGTARQGHYARLSRDGSHRLL